MKVETKFLFQKHISLEFTACNIYFGHKTCFLFVCFAVWDCFYFLNSVFLATMVEMIVPLKEISKYFDYCQKAVLSSSSLYVSRCDQIRQVERSQTCCNLHLFCVCVVMCLSVLVQVQVEMLKAVYYSDPIALLDCHFRCYGS